MIDIKIDSSGDFVIDAGSGDIDVTGRKPETVDDTARAIAQLVIFALKTDKSDFTIHSGVGNTLSDIWGLPNKPETANHGKLLIQEAIRSVGINNRVDIESWPEDLNTIVYEIKVFVDGQAKVMKMTIKQAVNGMRG